MSPTIAAAGAMVSFTAIRRLLNHRLIRRSTQPAGKGRASTAADTVSFVSAYSDQIVTDAYHVRALGQDFLGDGMRPRIVHKGLVLRRNELTNKELAVGVLQVDQVLADEGGIRTVRHVCAGGVVHHYVEVAIVEPASVLSLKTGNAFSGPSCRRKSAARSAMALASSVVP